jgi:hypothetical protein
MTKINTRGGLALLSIAALALTVGCTSLKTPATADVAVSNAAVANAASAGGAQYAPLEMTAAREKLALANKAMLAKDYKLAIELANQAQVDANQAQVDAKLAQSKASSVKAQAAADVLQDDIRVLREELDRPR